MFWREITPCYDLFVWICYCACNITTFYELELAQVVSHCCCNATNWNSLRSRVIHSLEIMQLHEKDNDALSLLEISCSIARNPRRKFTSGCLQCHQLCKVRGSCKCVIDVMITGFSLNFCIYIAKLRSLEANYSRYMRNFSFVVFQSTHWQWL